MGTEAKSNQEHFTARQKTDAVLRVLAGEAVETVAAELEVSVSRLERWKYKFVTAGADELARRTDIHVKAQSTKSWDNIKDWLLLFLALILLITLLVRMQG